MCFCFIHRLAILQLVDLPWFLGFLGALWKFGSSIRQWTLRRQRNANTDYWATGVACCQGKEPGVSLMCKEMVLITQILVGIGILLLIVMDFWNGGFISVKFEVRWRTRTFLWERCFKSSIWLSFGEVSQFVLTESPFLYSTNCLELELVVLHVAYTKKAFIDQKWFIPCGTLFECRRRWRKVEEWMLFSRVSGGRSHMLQERFSTTSKGLIKWLKYTCEDMGLFYLACISNQNIEG